MQTPNPKESDHGVKQTLVMILITVATVLMLTWAVATLFGLVLAKALAAVILVLFGICVAVLMVGLG